MRYFIIAVTMAILTFLGIIIKNKKNTGVNSSTLLKQPKYYLYAGIFGVIIFSLIAIIILYQETLVIASILILPLIVCILVSVGIIIFQLNWQLKIENDLLIYSNFFKKEKKFQIKKIIINSLSARYDVIYEQKTIIKISYLLECSTDFIKELQLRKK